MTERECRFNYLGAGEFTLCLTHKHIDEPKPAEETLVSAPALCTHAAQALQRRVEELEAQFRAYDSSEKYERERAASLEAQNAALAKAAEEYVRARCRCGKGVGHACGDGAPCDCPCHTIADALAAWRKGEPV